jgi:hypothetical protein
MILDGIEVPASDGNLLYAWRDANRNGSAHILLKGYSYVFALTQQPDEGDPVGPKYSGDLTTVVFA